MLHEKIEFLFTLLACTNKEIADASGCSKSNISHIRGGTRSFKPSSKAIRHLVEGIYCYALERGRLQMLCALTGTDETAHDQLIPELTAWLFDDREIQLPSDATLPKQPARVSHASKRLEFGNKLNDVMHLLKLSNARLARTISVDDSLVSRWRSGLRTPQNNEHLADTLIKALLERARSMDCESALAGLSGIPEEMLQEERGGNYLASWLFQPDSESVIPAMGRLLQSISSLSESSPDGMIPEELLYQPSLQKRYWNVEGLREAVLRFLMNAVHSGEELWLYSDESLTWMTGNAAFYATWKTLMAACMRAGIKIKIIHNINRKKDEMLTAISGWLPLYMSGSIEPFVFRKPQSSPFSHTFFLNPQTDCIYGTGIREHNGGWYDYITDSERLSVLSEEFHALFSCCEPLLKVYTGKEYDAHVQSISDLAESGQACRLLASPELPFPDIRICMTEHEVTVIHSKAPYTAFSFTAPDMLLAFREYFSTF